MIVLIGLLRLTLVAWLISRIVLVLMSVMFWGERLLGLKARQLIYWLRGSRGQLS